MAVMADLPAMLRLEGRWAVLIGGGAVARRRGAALETAGARLRVIAPSVDPTLARSAETVDRRPYADGDLAGAFLAVIAASDAWANEAAAAEARARGVLANRADAPAEGDLTVPAHERRGPLTVAVDTGWGAPAASAAVRDELLCALDPDWPRLLAVAGPFRASIQARFAAGPQRRERLRRTTDHRALMALKRGGTAALEARLARLADPTAGGLRP